MELDDQRGAKAPAPDCYRPFFDQMSAPAAVLDLDGRIDAINGAMRNLIGAEAEDVLHVPIWELARFGADGATELAACVRQAADGKATGNAVVIRAGAADASGCGASGGTFALSLKPMRLASGAVGAVILEVCEAGNAAGEAGQAKRVEAIRQMARVTAHDINNVLTVIGGNLELMRRRVADDGHASARLEKVIDAVFHGRVLTDRLLVLARDPAAARHAIDLREHISEVLSQWPRHFAEPAAIRTSIPADTWRCIADPLQLRSVMLHILQNALQPVDANAHRSTILINVSNVPCRAIEHTPPGSPCDQVAITIAWPQRAGGQPSRLSPEQTDGLAIDGEQGRVTIFLPAAGHNG